MKDFFILTLLLTVFVADLFFLVSYLGYLYKGDLDYRRMKTKRLPGLAFTSNVKMYASGPWLIYM